MIEHIGLARAQFGDMCRCESDSSHGRHARLRHWYSRCVSQFAVITSGGPVPYSHESRDKLLRRHRNGRTIEELARQIESTRQTIHNWTAQVDRDCGKRKELDFTSPHRRDR